MPAPASRRRFTGPTAAAPAVALAPAVAVLAVLAVAVLAPRSAAAQETITSDRPGLGSGSFVVDPGILQFEIGGEYAESDATDRISIGQGLLRYGVVDGLELHGIVGSFVVLPGDDDGTRGLLDVGLGAKLRLPSPDPALTWSVLGTVLFPTGAERLTADEIVPAATFLADVALVDGVGVTLNVGSSGWGTDAGDQTVLTLTPSVALPGSTPMAVYGGYAGYYASGGADLHYVEAGLTWLRAADLQLDVNSGVEVDGDGWFVGIGVAKRWRP
ncbi:MAG: transporter [Gemmatimonadetes bacterium]|nr:transporter [Gemmatimonadota bacterium]NNK64669.1 transporter [Gemmatimonadota bacterium]